MKPERRPWREYFLDLADVVLQRSTCPRLSVGAVLVLDKRVIATGYNGAPHGEQHCSEVGCELVENRCARVIHAELNALLQAARYGTRVEGGTMYITHEPCSRCAMYMRQAGVFTQVARRPYDHKDEPRGMA